MTEESKTERFMMLSNRALRSLSLFKTAVIKYNNHEIDLEELNHKFNNLQLNIKDIRVDGLENAIYLDELIARAIQCNKPKTE